MADDAVAQWEAAKKHSGGPIHRQSPMYVVPVRKFLEMSGGFRIHEEVKSAIVEWEAGMGDVTFVSHAWLRYSHPDSEEQQKFALLQTLLTHVLDGTQADVVTNPFTQAYYGKRVIPAATLRESLRDGFLWLECLCLATQPSGRVRA
jgi:hypothetical protein